MQRRWFFAGLVTLVIARMLLFLPAALDFRNFAFRDLGSFQHIDRLAGQGLRPGLDFGYSYGLLGVLLQRLYFSVFGAGHWPTIGLVIVYLVLMLLFWNLLTRDLGQTAASFGVLAGLSGLMIYVGPWPPTPAHVLLELSIAFSLYFVLENRLPLALAIAALGALAVPSLPIVLAGLIALAILWEWWRGPERSACGLLTGYAPAAAAYGVAVAILIGFYGWRAVLPSLLPLRGAAIYKAMNYGFFTRGPLSGRNFWDPPYPHIGHYLYTSAGIWLFCTALLVAFGCVAAIRMVRDGRPDRRGLFIVICCALHLFFIFAAFGGPYSVVYYSVILCAGVVAGISGLTNKRLTTGLSLVVLVFGVLSQHTEIKEGLSVWASGSRSPLTASLYTPNDFQPEWERVVSLANSHRVFLLAYGTGVDLYYPQIRTSQSWMLLPGLLVPDEEAAILRQVQTADVVIEDIRDPTLYMEGSKALQAALAEFPSKVSGNYFRIWSRQ